MKRLLTAALAALLLSTSIVAAQAPLPVNRGGTGAKSHTMARRNLLAAPRLGYFIVDSADVELPNARLLSTALTPTLTDYFYLPGRAGGQLGIGGTGASDQLKLRGNTAGDQPTTFQSSGGLAMRVQNIAGTLTPFSVGSLGSIVAIDPTVYSSSNPVMLDLGVSSTDVSNNPIARGKKNGNLTWRINPEGQFITFSSNMLTTAAPDGTGLAYAQMTSGGNTLGPLFSFGTREFGLDISGLTTGAANQRKWTIGNYSLVWPAAQGAANSVPTNNGSGTLSWTVPAGGVTGLANNTDSIGVVRVNGSATTAMRSDAAPPFKTSVSPTWSGTHTFSQAPLLSTMTSGSVLFAGTSGRVTQDNSNLFWDDSGNRLNLSSVGFNATGFNVNTSFTADNDNQEVDIDYLLPSSVPLANDVLVAGTVSAPDVGLTWVTPDALFNNVLLVTTTTSQLDKTASTAFTSIFTALPVSAGQVWRFRIVLFVNADAVGGHKYDLNGGTATVTSVISQVNSISNSTNLLVITSRQTSLAGSVGQAGATSVYTVIEGTITVNAGGTFNPRFAQNAASGTSSVLVGSYMELARKI